MIKKEHLEDLFKSGIYKNVAESNFIETRIKSEVESELGMTIKCDDALRIPVIGLDGEVQLDNTGVELVRYKIFNSEIKYLSPIGAGFGIYHPIGTYNLIQNTDTVVITEGEKKAIRGSLSGVPTIGLPGVCMWFDSEENDNKKFLDSIIDEKTKLNKNTKLNKAFFELYDNGIRKFVIIFDSDAKTNNNVRNAAYTLKDALETQLDGIKAYVSFIPSKNNKQKLGLDDWLQLSPSNDLKDLVDNIINAKDDIDNKKEILNKTQGFDALGVDGTEQIIYSRGRKMIVSMSPQKTASPSELQAICGVNFLKANYPKVNQRTGDIEVDYDKVTEDIFIKCEEAGHYMTESERGPGVWLDPENKDRLIINSGPDLLASDFIEEPRFKNKICYTMGFDLGYRYSKDNIGTVNDSREVLDAIKTFSWKKDIHAKMCFGWLALSTYTGALKWRSHIYVTAPRGAGKSTLLKLMQDIQGGSLKVDGSSSEAGIRQQLKTGSYTLFIDEQESDGKNTRNIITLARSASEGLYSFKGTSDQKGARFNIKFSAAMFGIKSSELNGADASRIVVLELLKANDKAKINPHDLVANPVIAKEVGMKLSNRMINNWPRFNRVLRTYEEVMINSKETGRLAQTLAPMFAAYWIATRDGELSYEEAFENYKLLSESISDLKVEMQENSRDEVSIVDKILSKYLTIQNGSDGINIKNPLNVFIYQALESKHINEELKKQGIKVDLEDNKVFLTINPTNDNFKNLLKGTEFENTDARKLLLRLDGAELKNSTRFASGTNPVRNAVKFFYSNLEDLRGN